MQAKLIQNDGTRTYALVFDEGEEALQGLKTFARENNLDAARFTAIGAFSKATLGFYNREQQDYDRIPVDEQVEVLSVMGNIALHRGKPKVHAHMVLGKRDGTAVGGQLMEGYVRPTLEVMVTEAPGHLRRKVDEQTQLPLISIE